MTLENRFEDLVWALDALERNWESEERYGLRRSMADMIHHVCAVIAYTDERGALAPYDRLTPVERELAHEAHHVVLEIGQLLLHDGNPPAELEPARVAVRALLETLSPHVSRADDALCRVLLDGESLQTALERIRRTA